MYVYHVYAEVKTLWDSSYSYKLSYWKLNPGPLEKHPVLLSAELSLPHCAFFSLEGKAGCVFPALSKHLEQEQKELRSESSNLPYSQLQEPTFFLQPQYSFQCLENDSALGEVTRWERALSPYHVSEMIIRWLCLTVCPCPCRCGGRMYTQP